MSDNIDEKVDDKVLKPEENRTEIEATKEYVTYGGVRERKDDLTVSEQVNNEEKKGKKKKISIESLEQLIEQAYAKKGHSIKINLKAEDQVRKKIILEPETLDRLFALGKSDATLSIPRQLLILSQIVIHPQVAGAIKEYVKETMLRHHVFKGSDLHSAIQNLPEGPNINQAVRSVVSGCLSLSEEVMKDLNIQKGKKLAELSVNAAYCLALWMAINRGYDPSQLARELYIGLWSQKAKKITSTASRWRALTDIKHLEGIGLVCKEFEQIAMKRTEERDEAVHEVEKARNEIETYKNDLQRVQEDLSTSRAKYKELFQELDREKEKGKIALTHLRDDIERMRTRVLNRLKEDAKLLDEGLVALRREPPKTHVMEDFAERVLEAMRQEIIKLSKED